MTARRALLAGLHVLGLWAVVVAQPLFDLLGANPEFFVAHGAGRAELLAVVSAVVLLVPAVLVAVVWLAHLAGRPAGSAVLNVTVGALAALLALQVLKRAGAGPGVVLLPLAAAAGVAAAVAYHRLAAVRSFATVLSLAVVVVPAALLLRPAYRRLLAPPPAEAAAPAGESRPVPVVVLVLDETPLASLMGAEGRIEEETYPNLAALARDGVWYRNASTVSDYTRWALPSIVTGQLPKADAAPSAADHPNSLFRLLSGTHRVEGLEAVTRLCPEAVCGAPADPLGTRLGLIASDLWIVYQHVVLPDDMKGDLPKLTGDWANFGAAADARQRQHRQVQRNREERRQGGGDNLRDRSEVTRRFIERITAEDPQPRLYFLHTMLPHTPHVLLPTGQLNGTLATPGVLELPRALPGKYKDAWTDDEWVLAASYQRHLLQLGYVDRVIGDMVQRLKDQGIYDRALIVILSDHGTSFTPGTPRRDYTGETAAEIVPVLLVVKFPAGTAAPAGEVTRLAEQSVSDRNVETIDVLPTVADVLGVKVPWETAGRSLLDTSAPERPSKVLYYDFAKRTRTFDRRGPDLGPIVRRKAALFGGPGNPYRVPRPPRFADLIGRPLSDLAVGEGGGTAVVDYLSEFKTMQTASDPVPFDVAGTLEGRGGRGGSPAYLAIAVNGTIRAVTRTWLHQPRAWLGTPPLSAWRNGENDLQVLVVDGDASNPRLRRCVVRQGKSRTR